MSIRTGFVMRTFIPGIGGLTVSRGLGPFPTEIFVPPPPIKVGDGDEGPDIQFGAAARGRQPRTAIARVSKDLQTSKRPTHVFGAKRKPRTRTFVTRKKADEEDEE
jgi:hypothetical protein